MVIHLYLDLQRGSQIPLSVHLTQFNQIKRNCEVFYATTKKNWRSCLSATPHRAKFACPADKNCFAIWHTRVYHKEMWCLIWYIDWLLKLNVISCLFLLLFTVVSSSGFVVTLISFHRDVFRSCFYYTLKWPGNVLLNLLYTNTRFYFYRSNKGKPGLLYQFVWLLFWWER